MLNVGTHRNMSLCSLIAEISFTMWACSTRIHLTSFLNTYLLNYLKCSFPFNWRYFVFLAFPVMNERTNNAVKLYLIFADHGKQKVWMQKNQFEGGHHR